MKFPTSNVGRFLLYFCIQFLQYALMVANGRAYVQGLYFATALTDTTIATVGFLVVRRLAREAQGDLHGWSMAGYVSGGTSGSLFAIWLTKVLYGQ